MKTNYTPAVGHDYDTVVIREASCQQGGLELHMCKKCGSYYTDTTSDVYKRQILRRISEIFTVLNALTPQ